MKRMGLEQAFRAKTVPEEGIQIVDSTGKQRAWFPATKPKPGQRQGFTTEYEIMRGDICSILHDAASSPVFTTQTGTQHDKKSAKFVYGASVQAFEHNDNAVEVRFEDGSTSSYDLVVGADGQWSRTRRLMVAADTSDSASDSDHGLHRIPGLYFAYFTMQQPIREGEGYVATSYLTSQRRGILTRRHSPTEMQVMLSFQNKSEHLENIRRGDVTAEKKAIADIFRGAGWRADEIVTSMMHAPDFYLERLGYVKLAPWSHGRVTLVGDAAHCPTVLTGMGTTSAMVGAYILAGEIGRHGSENLAAALESYEARFRPFIDQVQKGVVDNSASKMWMMMDTAMQIRFVNWLLGVASFLAKWINIADAFGIADTVKGWDLPEYQELKDVRRK